jgi:regulatory protein
MGRRVNVFVDDKFSFACDAYLAISRGLEAGKVLSASQLSELLQEDGDARALARALHFLSYRTRSEAEIRARLQRDQWPDEVISRVLEKLRDGGALNDAQFAQSYVNDRSLFKPRGARLLKAELGRKGVNKDTIEAALPDSDEELANAISALSGVARRFKKYEGREREQKMILWLQRRGFGFGVARDAVRQMEEE